MKTLAWHLVRIELAAAIVAIGASLLLILGEPNTMGPAARLVDQPMTWIGMACAVLGLAWMIRIFRADPEARASAWRFDRS
jgi:hypothetical protein